MIRQTAFCLILLTSLLGCGGQSTSQSHVGDAPATLRFSVEWPSESRFIHQRSDEVSIQVKHAGRLLDTLHLVRQPGSPTTTIDAPLVAPTGSVNFIATAYEASKPSIILSKASVSKVLLPGTLNKIDFTLNSSAVSIGVQRLPDKQLYSVGEELSLIPTALNAAGSVILNEVGDFQFTCSDDKVLQLDQSGQGSIVGAGSATVSVREKGNSIGALVGTVSVISGTQSMRYRLEVIPSLNRNGFTGRSLNSSGWAVGAFYPQQHPAFWNGAATKLIPLPPGASGGYGTAITDQGSVVGNTSQGAFFYRSGSTSIVDPPSNFEKFQFEDAVSDELSVGIAQKANDTQGFLWDGTSYTHLYSPWGGRFWPHGVNINGLIVGAGWSISDDFYHACSWRDGIAVDLGVLPGDSVSDAYAVNSRGLVVGWSAGAENGFRPQAFLFRDGSMQSLAAYFPTAIQSQGCAINDSDVAVGWVMFSSETNGFVYRPGVGASLLNDLLDSTGTGWSISAAFGINTSGQILGLGTDANGDTYHVRLTPSG